jgi:hypothetical protein
MGKVETVDASGMGLVKLRKRLETQDSMKVMKETQNAPK